MTERGALSLQIDDPEQKRRVKDFFDQEESWKGKIYNDQTVRFNRAMTRRKQYVFQALERLEGLTSGATLDIGCGCGIYSEELMRKGFDVHGMDLSPQILESCKHRLGLSEQEFALRFRAGDIENIPFADASFDLVLCIGVFGYLLSDQKALMEAHRVLKPGGYFLVTVQNLMSLSNVDYSIRKNFGSLWERKTAPHNHQERDVAMTLPWVFQHSSTHHQYKSYNPWKWEKVIQRHGFQKIDSLTYGQEFRVLRRLRALPEALLTSAEIVFDKVFRRAPVPYLRYAGESYTGVFRKL